MKLNFKMGTRKKVTNLLILAFSASLILIWWLNQDRISDHYRYTVANVHSIEAVLDGDPAANISYTVNGKTYNGSGSRNLGYRD
jgi:hypothetical protein